MLALLVVTLLISVTIPTASASDPRMITKTYTGPRTIEFLMGEELHEDDMTIWFALEDLAHQIDHNVVILAEFVSEEGVTLHSEPFCDYSREYTIPPGTDRISLRNIGLMQGIFLCGENTLPHTSGVVFASINGFLAPPQ